ncbi:MAG: N-formylglutamate amidohydrolase [Gammaproteobacteria bacterium]
MTRKHKSKIIISCEHGGNQVPPQYRRLFLGKQSIFSVHSFTPKLGKELRRADIGLLYDPRRRGERILCRKLQAILSQAAKGLIVRRNYPYRGTDDGLTTYLRKRYSEGQYLGIEIEINQKHVHGSRARRRRLRKQIIRAIALSISHLAIPDPRQAHAGA